MKINLSSKNAFTILEVIAGMTVCGIVFISLYAGLSQGFRLTQIAREDLRATQVMIERLESVRLCTYEQLNTPGFVPTDPVDEPYYWSTNQNGGFNYSVTVTVSNAPFNTSYSDDLKLVNVKVTWTASGMLRTREMNTLIAKNGLQTYVF